MKIESVIDDPLDTLYSVSCVLALLQDFFSSVNPAAFSPGEKGLTGLYILCESMDSALTEVFEQLSDK